MRHHEHEARSRRTRLWWFRARAVLAGGLVLGIGSAATLAAWNDGEFATATITAGTFQIEGSPSSSTAGFADHTTAGTAAALSFSAPVSAMTPGTTTYSSYYVRTKSTSVAGTIALQTPTFPGPTGLQTTLTYAVRLVAVDQACTATVFSTPIGTSIVTAGTTLNATLAAPSPVITAAGSTTHRYCFAITLPASAGNGVQGQSAVPTWQFLATAS